MKVINSGIFPIKLWANELDEVAMEQARELANLPFVHKHVALMPDAHAGYGMPIGGVLATKGVVIPNAVGVDIGCGMLAVQTNLEDAGTGELKQLICAIRKRIPVGVKSHSEAQDSQFMPLTKTLPEIVGQNYKCAHFQLGTLGGGNHFIEIQHGSDGRLWVMIHSGSRNLGKQVAEFYNKKAIQLNKLWYSEVRSSSKMAFLPVNSVEGRAYLNEMDYCVKYALANRQLMMRRVHKAFCEVFHTAVNFGESINIPHNYVAWENHFGENVLVHRKGATRARKGDLGLIPGSQGSASYIVEGLGNPESFMSSSHGAGRRLARKQARIQLNLKEEIDRLNRRGIIHSINSQQDLDEATGAYKSIEEVMQNQRDLVKTKVTLEPLAVVKG